MTDESRLSDPALDESQSSISDVFVEHLFDCEPSHVSDDVCVDRQVDKEDPKLSRSGVALEWSLPVELRQPLLAVVLTPNQIAIDWYAADDSDLLIGLLHHEMQMSVNHTLDILHDACKTLDEFHTLGISGLSPTATCIDTHLSYSSNELSICIFWDAWCCRIRCDNRFQMVKLPRKRWRRRFEFCKIGPLEMLRQWPPRSTLSVGQLELPCVEDRLTWLRWWPTRLLPEDTVVAERHCAGKCWTVVSFRSLWTGVRQLISTGYSCGFRISQRVFWKLKFWRANRSRLGTNDGELILQDLGSTYGTWIKMQRVESGISVEVYASDHIFLSGDLLQLIIRDGVHLK